MSTYSSRLIITIPAALLPVARSIARALDPDVGGYNSYMPIHSEIVGLDDDGNPIYADPTHWAADTPCRPEFVAQAMYLINNPAALHAAVAADYAARWPDLTPPTLSECQAFCAGAVLTTAPPPSIE